MLLDFLLSLMAGGAVTGAQSRCVPKPLRIGGADCVIFDDARRVHAALCDSDQRWYCGAAGLWGTRCIVFGLSGVFHSWRMARHAVTIREQRRCSRGRQGKSKKTGAAAAVRLAL